MTEEHIPTTPKKKNWKTTGIIILAILLGIAFFNNPFITKAQKGDVVAVTYTGTLQNGTVFDTNIETTAQRNDIHKPSYQPLVFTISSGQMIPGFDKAVQGMKEGQTKTVNIKAKNAYGKYDENKVIQVDRRKVIQREITLGRTQNIAREEFEKEFNKKPVIGDTASSNNTIFKKSTITTFDATSVTLRADPTIGEIVMLPDIVWPSTVIDLDAKSIVVRQDPDETKDITSALGPVEIIVFPTIIHMVLKAKTGDKINLPTGPATIKSIEGYVVEVDANHELAGKDLTFEITLDEIRSLKKQ